jgi:hypothetical protein
MSKTIKSFIRNVIEENYAAANKDLDSAIKQIIKQKIANNLKNKSK